ncbi:hypothetical protein ACG6P0_000431 [Enterococcus hirae]|uniref:hypothetical protein n=1 Tax=Enterococcus TaxID=1350 RepID=UPI0005564007|nr:MULTISPECIES: hypothetical protein [Enterococcus]OWW69160.1 hypothetical protein C655_06415 [Enterococcus hirae 57-09-G6]EMF0054080.1 hypothetical protein [Enterococcus hirae]EMF0057150.1 hypothetical protein [Enterococcus hirae]EMF0072925.1 hypothetical protein [Enterococcus hirae]EMF0111077.1 hypothetical protein [Enterococcus hirae]
MSELKILFENVTKSSGWSGPQIATSLLAALAACISLIGIIQTGKWNKKKIDADITARARIDWIQITRAKISTFISSSYELLTFFDPNNYSEINSMDLLNIKRQNLRESAIQLGIMFGPDEDNLNQKVVRFADLITEEAIQNQGMDSEYMIKLQDQFIIYRDFLNYYLKIEWKRANLSLSDREAKKKQLENPMKKKLEDLLKEKEERLRKNREARISAMKHLQE